MRFNHTLALLALACASLPAAAQEPAAPPGMPDAWQYDEAFDQQLPVEDGWWREFHDATLDSLIAIGVDNNYNVLMAQRRVEMARQQLRQAQAAYFPQLSLGAGWTRSQTSGMTGPEAGRAAAGSYFDLGITMNWQIDVFGQVAERAKQSKAAFKASRAEYAGTMVTVCAKIATAYFQLRSLQSEIDLLDKHIASQKRVVEITEARHEAGLASMLDVSQARTTYYSTLASITSLRSSETATINALAVLLGVYPEDAAPLLGTHAPLPDYHQIVAVGVPMELLRRRPDVVAAEHELAAYAAALGVAKKDFLPAISLRGSIGSQARRLDDLMGKQSLSYSIAPTLSWTIFDGLARNAAVASAKEQMLAGIDNYNLTVVTAVQEVETAMSNYQNDIQYIEYLAQVVDEAHRALVLSVDLYKQGLTTFINVTNSQITLLQYANQLVVARGQALSDLVSLYEALGGGWSCD